MFGKYFSKHSALGQTVRDYANRSTVHGLGYILDKDLGRGDRVLWIIICLCFASLAVHLTNQAYNNWQDNQVVITLKNTAKPVNQIKFPAVTICSSGLHMDLVETVITDSFLKWHNSSTEPTQANMAEYMAEYFNIRDKTGNIMDILDTMVATSVEASVAANSVRDNIIACREDTPTVSGNTMGQNTPAVVSTLAEKNLGQNYPGGDIQGLSSLVDNTIGQNPPGGGKSVGKRETTSENGCCSRLSISSTKIAQSSQFAAQALGLYQEVQGTTNNGTGQDSLS